MYELYQKHKIESIQVARCNIWFDDSILRIIQKIIVHSVEQKNKISSDVNSYYGFAESETEELQELEFLNSKMIPLTVNYTNSSFQPDIRKEVKINLINSNSLLSSSISSFKIKTELSTVKILYFMPLSAYKSRGLNVNVYFPFSSTNERSTTLSARYQSSLLKKMASLTEMINRQELILEMINSYPLVPGFPDIDSLDIITDDDVEKIKEIASSNSLKLPPEGLNTGNLKEFILQPLIYFEKCGITNL